MEDIKKGLVGVTKAITKGSGALIKSTKLTLSLTNEEAKLKSIYTEIGEKVREIYSYGGSLGEFFDKKYLEILEQQRKVDDLKAARDVAKGVVTCQKCGKTSPRGSAFCPKCGETMMDDIADEHVHEAAKNEQHNPYRQNTEIEEQTTAPPEPVGKKCNTCGGINDIGDRFCLSCGRII